MNLSRKTTSVAEKGARNSPKQARKIKRRMIKPWMIGKPLSFSFTINPTTIHMISSRQWPVYVSGVRDKLDGSSSVSMKQVQ
jgi:hypothetical protein